ncbi:MAG TPA: ribbon-helix-helix protein, CopG family [Thermomicrobiales bacterium]|jgi:antitoxin ParD1/3/4
MSLTLPADVAAKVREMVESGRYSDSGEALREAVDLLEERDRRLEWLRAAIAKSDEQIARGEGIPNTPELLDEIDREVDELIRRGHVPSPDVCP